MKTMEILVLAGLIGAGIISGYSNGYTTSHIQKKSYKATDLFRIYTPDDIHPTHAWELTSENEVSNLVDQLRAAVVRTEYERRSYGHLTGQERFAQGVQFQQEPFSQMRRK